MSAMSLTTPFGSASPRPFIATMDGRHLAEATLEGVSAGERPFVFVRFDMVDVVITSYQTSAGDSAPSESFSLEFAKVTYTYWSQKPDGALGEEISVTWDSVTRQAS